MADDTVTDTMTVAEAMELLGCPSKAALARALGVSRQHVHNWQNGIPLLRVYQVRELARVRAASASLEK